MLKERKMVTFKTSEKLRRHINEQGIELKPRSFLILFLVVISISIPDIPAHASSDDKPQILNVHTVKAGDSLSKIAFEYYGDYTQITRIAEFNDIKNVNQLKIGQKIKLPVLSSKQSKKTSRIDEVDLGISDQIGADGLEEKSLTRGQIFLQPNPTIVLFIIIFLLILLCLSIVKWLRLEDNHHVLESEDAVKPNFTMKSEEDEDTDVKF